MGSMFTGALVMVGFGSVGQGVLPLLMRDLSIPPERVTVVKTRPDQSGIARTLGARVIGRALDADNFEAVLEPLLAPGDFLLNVSVDVSSVALLAAVPQARRAVPGHLQRALARALRQPRAQRLAALELRIARGGAVVSARPSSTARPP